MAEEFKQRLKDAYQEDSQWKRILDMVKPPQQLHRNAPIQKASEGNSDEDATNRPQRHRFAYRNGLIYYIDEVDGRERLCIPSQFEKGIFELAHARQHHGGFHRTYDRITASLFIHHLTRRLKA